MKIKSLFALFLVLSALFTCSSCSQTSPKTTSHSNDDDEVIGCSHKWLDATCIEPKTCSLCNKTKGSALGHTTEAGICSRCGENFGTWKASNYVDEFDNPTGKRFISTTVFGTFSNSATTNSNLTAAIQVDTEGVSIILWEYSSHQVKCSYKYDNYSITMLDTKNEKHTLSGTMYAGGFRIYIDEENETTVINALKQSGSISFHVVNSEYTTSKYTFTIETSNFSTLYQTLTE